MKKVKIFFVFLFAIVFLILLIIPNLVGFLYEAIKTGVIAGRHKCDELMEWIDKNLDEEEPPADSHNNTFSKN